MFFFADYEGYRRLTRQLTFSTLPTADERNGILAVPIVNPLNGRTYTDGRVPLSDMTPFARKVLSDLPANNRAGTSQNFEAPPRRSDQTDKGDFRFDYYPASKLTTFARYSHRLMNNFEPPAIPGPSGGNSNGNVRVLNYQLAFGATYTITPVSLLDFRLGYSITEGGNSRSLSDSRLCLSLMVFPVFPRIRASPAVSPRRRSAARPRLASSPPIRSSRIRRLSIPKRTIR